MSVYDRVIDENPFSPLVIDLSPKCPNHRYMLRKNVLPGQYPIIYELQGGGRVVRWSWLNFQCRGVLLVWIRVGQGPTALAVGAGGGCLDIFTLIYPFSSFSLSLGDDPI